MAMDNWFQNWHPPFLQDTYFQPTKNVIHEENARKFWSIISDFYTQLFFVLTLTLSAFKVQT